MLNQMVIVGRIAHDLEIIEQENRKVVKVLINVPRNFKNNDGVYDTDIIECILYDNVAENIAEYCKKDDIVGIKGRIERLDINDSMQLVADKVTFLSTSKEQ